VLPLTEPWIDPRMIDWIKAGISAIYRVEKGQQMHASEEPLEGTHQQVCKIGKATAPKALNIRNQLHLVLHARIA
jgi:hypothetical protein